MPPIWDEPPDPGFAPLPYPSVPQYGPPPMLPPTSDPNLFAEMQGQQEQMPNDFWARLAQGAGPSPFGQPTVPNKPTGLEVLLAIAQGFGNAKAGQGAKRVDETTARNARARDAAKTLAMWRHDERKAQQVKLDNEKNLLSNRAYKERMENTPMSPERRARIVDEHKAAAEGTRLGAPLRPRTPPTKPVKNGPTFPTLQTAASNILNESRAWDVKGEVALADSTRNLAGQIKDFHAALRDAQTKDEIDSLSIPDGMPISVQMKVRDALIKRHGQVSVSP